MSISFNEIPLDVRTFGQYIEIDNSRAVQGSPAKPHKALAIGQRLSAGTVAEGVPTLVPSADAAEAYFGVGSQLAEMCRAFKKANRTTELWAIALDDNGSAVAATKTITVATATTTAAGTVYVYVAGHRIAVPIDSGTDQDDVAYAIHTAIQTHPEYARMPFTSGLATNVVTLTARNGGVAGNSLDVRLNYQQGEQIPAGLVSIVVAAGATGSADPDLSTAITAMGDVQYDTIAMASNVEADIEELGAELLTRWGGMVQKEGHAFVAAVGNQSTLTTLGNGLNLYPVTLFEVGGSGGNSPTPHYVAAAVVAAVSASETQKDPARPRQTLPLPGVLPPEPSHQFTREERNILLTDGVSTHYVDAGGTVRIERLITTYQTNALSIVDPSYLDETTVRNLAQLRYEVRTRIGLKYPRHKLADNGTLYDPGQAVVTPNSIRAELIGLFREWEGRALVEDFEQFKEDLIVERNSGDPNRIDVRMSPDLVNQFRVFAGQIQFLL
jgi:phage tail sheath gpL-like